MKIAILGATGKTGTHLVDQALRAGHEVVVYVRRPEALAPREKLTVFKGQLDDVAAMASAFSGADAVVSCIGPAVNLQSILKTDLMQRYLPSIISAVHKAGVGRFVLVSAFGVGDTADKASFVARLAYKTAMASIFTDKARAEAVLPSTGLNWTTVYPVILSDAPLQPGVKVTPIETVAKVPGMPKVPFANVAAVLLDLAADQGKSGQRLLIAP